MSKLADVLYPVPDLRRTPLSLLKWWESRRLLYNEVVGVTGLFSLGVVVALGTLPPHPAHFEPRFLLVGPLVYALAANLLYCLGWTSELVARWLWRERAPRMGPLLFRQGLIFSVGLTLLPIAVASFSWLVRVLVTLAG
ncbi:MAG TPA: hypothetical protein VFL93_16865 [Longimicrobiaceae bacterium]|jgi:hypothetical protein|nr:hypothetical protein [Longimicrobiaceae bacterium]